MKILSLALLFTLLGISVQASSLEDVTDAELTKLIKQEQYVIVLFSMTTFQVYFQIFIDFFENLFQVMKMTNPMTWKQN